LSSVTLFQSVGDNYRRFADAVRILDPAAGWPACRLIGMSGIMPIPLLSAPKWKCLGILTQDA
jgi:hypothetical protein